MDLGKEIRVIEVEEEIVAPTPSEIEPPIRVEEEAGQTT